MNRAFSQLVTALCLSAACLSLSAQTVEASPPATKIDAKKGEAIYSNGDATRNIIACVSCHGAAGNSTIVQNPKLAAQHEAYLYKQLLNFKGPDRQNAIMTSISKALTDEDMKNISAYLSEQAAKPNTARNKESLELGKTIYRAGIAEKNVPACAGCHSPNGAGIPAQYPRLAGQHQDYTTAQLINFRTKARKNSEQMSTIAHRMSDDEMKAVADYVAGLK